MDNARVTPIRRRYIIPGSPIGHLWVAHGFTVMNDRLPIDRPWLTHWLTMGLQCQLMDYSRVIHGVWMVNI